AALHRARVDERFLDRMHALAGGEALDGLDVPPGRRAREDQARAHQLAVHEHRARAALALLAGILAAGERELLAEHGEQALVLAGLELARRVVHAHAQPHAIAPARDATAMTIALRVPILMNVCDVPASSHSAATTSSS